MDFLSATAAYEAWCDKQVPTVAEARRDKHHRMRTSLFSFLRGTYYRWSQRWADLPESSRVGPSVMAVGDLHIENFGTWRDAEGRLVWGVNDLDETDRLSSRADLARLFASVVVAVHEAHLHLHPGRAEAAILEGYQQALTAGGRPPGWLAALVDPLIDGLRADWRAWQATGTA